MKNTQSEIKEDFEANMLDGDKVEDCGGTMLSAKSVYEYLIDTIPALVEKAVEEELKNRLLTIKWLWNKEKTDIGKLLMVQKQLLMFAQLTNTGRKKNENK